MKVEIIRERLRERPFRPFFIHLPEGRKVRVFHPDFALISPGGRTLVVFEEEDVSNFIDIMLISSIEIEAQPKVKAKAKSAPRGMDA